MSKIMPVIFCETRRTHLLDGYLEHMENLQPTAFHLRMFVPLFMIQLGEDDRAYNFIKFWVEITPFQVKELVAWYYYPILFLGLYICLCIKRNENQSTLIYQD